MCCRLELRHGCVEDASDERLIRWIASRDEEAGSSGIWDLESGGDADGDGENREAGSIWKSPLFQCCIGAGWEGDELCFEAKEKRVDLSLGDLLDTGDDESHEDSSGKLGLAWILEKIWEG